MILRKVKGCLPSIIHKCKVKQVMLPISTRHNGKL